MFFHYIEAEEQEKPHSPPSELLCLQTFQSVSSLFMVTKTCDSYLPSPTQCCLSSSSNPSFQKTQNQTLQKYPCKPK